MFLKYTMDSCDCKEIRAKKARALIDVYNHFSGESLRFAELPTNKQEGWLSVASGKKLPKPPPKPRKQRPPQLITVPANQGDDSD